MVSQQGIRSVEEDEAYLKAWKRDYISAVEHKIDNLAVQMDKRVEAERIATTLALEAADKTTAIAQSTAERAVAKAEAAADKEYLQAQIVALRETLMAQLIAQKEAINAALVSAKDALTAAQQSSERAIQKAEESNEKRFQSVNEFRNTLSDQQKTLATKAECEFRFLTNDKKFEDLAQWSRATDLKFNNYLTMEAWNVHNNAQTVWRRQVDEQLTEARSKSGFIYSLIAMSIAVGGLLVAIFNLFTKAPPPTANRAELSTVEAHTVRQDAACFEIAGRHYVRSVLP